MVRCKERYSKTPSSFTFFFVSIMIQETIRKENLFFLKVLGYGARFDNFCLNKLWAQIFGPSK